MNPQYPLTADLTAASSTPPGAALSPLQARVYAIGPGYRARNVQARAGGWPVRVFLRMLWSETSKKGFFRLTGRRLLFRQLQSHAGELRLPRDFEEQLVAAALSGSLLVATNSADCLERFLQMGFSPKPPDEDDFLNWFEMKSRAAVISQVGTFTNEYAHLFWFSSGAHELVHVIL